MYKNDRQTASKCKTFVLGFYGYNISAAFSAMTIIIATFTFTGFFHFVLFLFILQINKRLKTRQRSKCNAIQRLRFLKNNWNCGRPRWIESIQLNCNEYAFAVLAVVAFTSSVFGYIIMWLHLISQIRYDCLMCLTSFLLSISSLVFSFQAKRAQQIYNENEEKLEEMLDGIEKLFGYVLG